MFILESIVLDHQSILNYVFPSIIWSYHVTQIPKI